MGENQFLRWGIPGWMFILVIISYWITTPSFSTDLILSKNHNLVGPISFIISAGIPLGFIIYQIYFMIDWLFHQWWEVSKKILTGINSASGTFTDEDLKIEDFHYPVCNVQKEIQVVELLWNKTLYGLGKDADFLMNRLRYMLGVLHSLGASLVAVIVGNLMSFIIFYVILGHREIDLFSKLGVVLFLWFFVLFVIYTNRHYTQYNIIYFQNSVMRKIPQKIKS